MPILLHPVTNKTIVTCHMCVICKVLLESKIHLLHLSCDIMTNFTTFRNSCRILPHLDQLLEQHRTWLSRQLSCILVLSIPNHVKLVQISLNSVKLYEILPIFRKCVVSCTKLLSLADTDTSWPPSQLPHHPNPLIHLINFLSKKTGWKQSKGHN